MKEKENKAMKKTVKVEDIIRLAKNWSIDSKKLILEYKMILRIIIVKKLICVYL